MGRVTVRALTEYTDVDQITIADYNEGRAREVAASLKSSESSRSSGSSGSSNIVVEEHFLLTNNIVRRRGMHASKEY